MKPLDLTSSRPVYKFRRVEINEPIRVLVGLAETALDVGGCLAELQARVETRLILVINIPDGLREEDLADVLRVAAALSDRLVLTADERGRQAWGQLLLSDIDVSHCQIDQRGMVFTDPLPGRAVIAAMQGLNSGETFAVIWPNGSGFDSISSLVVQGARWRATWEAPEDGEFHYLPQQPDSP